MKKTLIIGLVFSLLLLSACVNEKPEPTYVPPNLGNQRILERSDTAGGLLYQLYSDQTAEIAGLDADFYGTEIEILEYFEDYAVIGIEAGAFRDQNVTSVSLPQTLTFIGEGAFQRSQIREITLPDSLTELGKEAFDNCLLLEKVSFGKNLKEIPTGAFYNCKKLKKLNLPEGLEKIGEEAFGHCIALEELTLPSSLRSVGPWAFYQSGTDSLAVEIPEGVKEVGSGAFDETAFMEKQKEEFVIAGDGVLIAYRGTARAVTVPDSVRYVGASFGGTSVETLFLPKNLEGICSMVFEDSNVKKVHYEGENPSVLDRLPLN